MTTTVRWPLRFFAACRHISCARVSDLYWRSCGPRPRPEGVGIIGGRHTLLNISYHTASQIGQLHQLQALWLHTFDSAVEADSPLTSALDVFTEIEFAFVVFSAGAARLFDVNVPCRLQIKKLKSDAVGHCNERSKENRKIQQEMWVQLASISTLLEYSSIQKI